MPKFQDGHKKLGGRKAGTLNKFTTLKNDWLEVHARLGGVDGLFEYAKAHRGWFYTNQTKLFPQDVQHAGADGGPIQAKVIVEVVKTHDTESGNGNGGNGGGNGK